MKAKVTGKSLSDLEVVLPPVNLTEIDVPSFEIEGLDETLADASMAHDLKEQGFELKEAAKEFMEERKNVLDEMKTVQVMFEAAVHEYDRHVAAVRERVFAAPYNGTAITISETADMLKGTPRYDDFMSQVRDVVKQKVVELFPEISSEMLEQKVKFDQYTALAATLLEEANKCGSEGEAKFAEAEVYAARAGLKTKK